MADKISKKKQESIGMEGELLDSVNYATYYCRIPLFNELKLTYSGSTGMENLTVEITGSTELIIDTSIPVPELPPESSVDLETGGLLNPKYLAELEAVTPCVITVSLISGKNVLRTLETEVTALPMTHWSGLSGNVEMLASFVRPGLSDCQKVVGEAGAQLKSWGYSSEWGGYVGNDKNAVRNALAAVYAAIRHLDIERVTAEGGDDYSVAVDTGDVTQIVSKKKATPVELALFTASCLESVRLNPVIVVGKDKIAVGVWLYESCFSVSVQDDMSVVEKFVSDGVNNIGVVDVDDLFAHKNANYTTSEGHFRNALSAGKYDICLDVRRCRIGGVYSMPLKIKNGKNYELLRDEDLSYESRPKEIVDSGKYDIDKKISKEDNWQRRLLDLSMKNNLLNFKYTGDCMHVECADMAVFISKMEGNGTFTLSPSQYEKSVPAFGAARNVASLGELIGIELSSGQMRVFGDARKLSEDTTALTRKARVAQEEVGNNTLYLAFGFLQWKNEDEKEAKYAPLCLLPVTLRRGKHGITLECGDEYEVNTTLLEFLYREFGIDMRGIEGKQMHPMEIMAAFRGNTANKSGWKIEEDVYVAQFTFARYAMWKDVRDHMPQYRDNALIASLLSNKCMIPDNKLSGDDEDYGNPADVLLPLQSDSSQYSAVAESAQGTTFVLHGPPGTGKSQTITNIIANALDSGKRVLFVAEKQAALQVVKKRLVEIGLGDFCLELHSGKVDKSEIVRGIENTLALATTFDSESFDEQAVRVRETRDSLKATSDALHKKRRIGVSIYEGIMIYLQNQDAPDLMDVESTFYDSLTRQKIVDYENMILTAQVAANECGGVYRSPFDNVNITDCGNGKKEGIMCVAEVLLAELKHLKNYAGLILDTFNQKMSTFTGKKLANLIDVVTSIMNRSLNVFFECDEEDFYQFYNANIRYDNEVRHWLKHFKTLPDLGKLTGEIEKELDNWGENYRSSKVLVQVLKRINRCSREPVKEKDELEWIRHAYEIEHARETILTKTDLSKNFTSFGGGINDKKREEFLRPLYRMHALNAQTFMDYNADAFNSVCVRAVHEGNMAPLLNGFLSAASSFNACCREFSSLTNADTTKISDEDLVEYYTAKCTALIDNIDMLPAWCLYKSTAKALNDCGLTFMTDAMENGRINGDQVISSFRKSVYRNFVTTNIPADDVLSHFSAAVLDETATNFSMLLDSFSKLTREKIRSDLISRLPSPGTEGPLSVELVTFQRSIKGNMRGFDVRNLFTEIPELMKVCAPCILMSPATVSQYLPPDPGMFDMIIFDEASQVPTCEAVPALARGKSAIIVGDPKQMPPTSFFMNMNSEDVDTETDDLESVLDDCLALGIPEKHLNWHYRSKHESLIAFSNIMYYGSKLCTYPSPDALESRVTLRYIENGIYDRGATKCNKQEAEALINEVIRRLKDDRLSRQSIGIVTFSTPQQDYIERLLNKEIIAQKLESVAYEREEPLFVKNLENVQGDERDVILFSVCYGFDRLGKLSLNFGPLNQYGGWRRLNVAVSRAREEMVVFSSMRYSAIDLSRTSSRGVAGLKAFLEFAEKGRMSIAVKSNEMIVNKNSIGKFVAAELENYGYECRCDVGVSDFKIDVAVLDPKNSHNFILAILCDGSNNFSVKDRTVMQVQTLKRSNWNVIRLYSVNFFNNPKREVKKIKEYLDKLTQTGGKAPASAYRKTYRPAKIDHKPVDSNYIVSGENDAEVIRNIKAIVAAEEPISVQFLIKRVMSVYGITKCGIKLEHKLRTLIDKCDFESREMVGNVYLFRSDKYSDFERYRVEEGTPIRTAEDYTPFDVISLVKSILLNKVSMYIDELASAVCKEFGIGRGGEKMNSFIYSCIDEGVSSGLFIRSISDKISLC